VGAAALLAIGLAGGCRSRAGNAPPAVSRPAPAAPLVAPGTVHLYREVLTLRVDGRRVCGQALYHFRNPEHALRQVPTALAFHTAGAIGPPRNIRFAHVTADTDESLSFAWLEDTRPMVELTLPAAGRFCLRVDWEQDLRATQFVYILRRDPPWKTARESFRLTLYFPRAFRNVRLNYPVTHSFSVDAHQCFVLAAEPFDPDRDLIVSWEPPQGER